MLSDKVGNGDIVNIGHGKNYSVNEVADMISNKKTYGETRIEPAITLADNTKARTLLGWNPKGDLPTWISNNIKGSK
jgi:UDP-glucose 4-epimerase